MPSVLCGARQLERMRAMGAKQVTRTILLIQLLVTL
ncbi:MAG: hypothetical protein H6R48_1127, partial [Proteobacteria bacterium]|nr:hypothetical protein [Pseudomonadota bacterium]